MVSTEEGLCVRSREDGQVVARLPFGETPYAHPKAAIWAGAVQLYVKLEYEESQDGFVDFWKAETEGGLFCIECEETKK